MDAQSSQTPDNLVEQLRFQLSTTRNRVVSLQQEIYDMQADFDYKQSKMKERYFEKENDARQQNLKLLDAGRQISAMESAMRSLKEEIENVKMIASVSENTKEEAVQELNTHHQEEIESLRQVLHESMEEQRRDLVVQFEQERRRWEEEKAVLKEEKAEARVAFSKLENSPQMKRKEENDQRKKASELNMKKAQIETETLKAVVLPLEAEIAELKEKLQWATKSEEGARTKVENQSFISSSLTAWDATEQSGVPSITYDKAPNDDDGFTPFQSYPTQHIPPSSTSECEPAATTLSQDSLSISSVSSLPSSTGLVPNDMSQTQRVLSAPHLSRLGIDQSSLKKARAWDEIASDATDRSESPQECLEFACTTSHADQELKALKDKCLKLQEEATELRKLLDKERKIRIQVEESVAHASEEAQKQIMDLTKKLTDLEGRMEEDKAWRKRKETEDDKRLSTLQRDRENFNTEFLQIKKENDRVRTFYEKHRMDLSKEPVLALNLEGLNFQVRKYREALLAARVEKSHVESRLQSKLGFMQERLNAEQVAKEQLEITLSAELDQVNKELTTLRGIKGKLHREASEKRDLLAQAEKDQLSFDSIRNKSKEIIKGLREKLKTETTLKEELESKLSATKNQVSSLQDALKTSEQVQQDFVRLSQSLQMKLEEIRQREEGGVFSKFNSHTASKRTDSNFDFQSSSRSPD